MVPELVVLPDPITAFGAPEPDAGIELLDAIGIWDRRQEDIPIRDTDLAAARALHQGCIHVKRMLWTFGQVN